MQRICLVFTFFFILLSGSAQVPHEKTLLWQITGNGITQPSYLFGTIHLMCAADLKIPSVVKEKFNTAAVLYLEIDMDDPNMMQQMMASMQMKNAETLEKLMGAQFDSANAVFKSSTGLPLTMLNTTKPMLVMSMVYPSLLGCLTESWESVFQTMAKDRSIDIRGLEKVQDQLDMFEKIPYQEQSNMLAKTLLHMDSTKAQFNELLDVYQKKDIDQLNRLISKEEDFGDYQDMLLSARNHNWIPVIGEEAKKRPTFFAFGAGHLAGETGVINLLRKAGFTVLPVFYD